MPGKNVASASRRSRDCPPADDPDTGPGLRPATRFAPPWFDFKFQPSIDERLVRELATLSRIPEATNVLLLGPPGVGKTHLAVALGFRAIEHGKGVCFVRAHQLLDDLGRAQAEHRLDRRLRLYLAPKVLIIDEFGVWPYDRTAATALFTPVSARYERGSIIVTSNKGFGESGEVLGDSVIATAILDRLLYHSHVLNMRGESYRLHEERRAGPLGGAATSSPARAPEKTLRKRNA